MKNDSDIARLLQKERLIAVLIVEALEDAVPLARALWEGGIRALELTLRTPIAFDALEAMRSEVPGMATGLGTVLTVEQVRQARASGAAFAVAPGMNRKIVEAAREAELPFAPGIMTPSEIEAALELECQLLKYFPAEPMGGIKTLSSMAAPYLHREVRFIPLGGISPRNAAEYFASDLVAAVGGSWIAPRDLIQRQKWDDIRELASAAVAMSKS